VATGNLAVALIEFAIINGLRGGISRVITRPDAPLIVKC